MQCKVFLFLMEKIIYYDTIHKCKWHVIFLSLFDDVRPFFNTRHASRYSYQWWELLVDAAHSESDTFNKWRVFCGCEWSLLKLIKIYIKNSYHFSFSQSWVWMKKIDEIQLVVIYAQASSMLNDVLLVELKQFSSDGSQIWSWTNFKNMKIFRRRIVNQSN